MDNQANKQIFKEWTKKVGGADNAVLILVNELGLSIRTCQKIVTGNYAARPHLLARRRINELIGKRVYDEAAS